MFLLYIVIFLTRIYCENVRVCSMYHESDNVEKRQKVKEISPHCVNINNRDVAAVTALIRVKQDIQRNYS